MKTPRELILARHQSAEAKLKAIRAEDLAACARSAGEASRRSTPAFDLMTAAVRVWQEAFWPWRRAWLGMAAIWVAILAFGLAARDTPNTTSARSPRPDPQVLAVLRGQKQLLAQLLGPEALPLILQLQIPGPRSAVEPPPGANEKTRRFESTQRAEPFALV